MLWGPIHALQLSTSKGNAFIGFDWVTAGHVDRVTAEFVKSQQTQSSSLDKEIIGWLLCSLYRDQDLEQFLEGISCFYHSTLVENPGEICQDFHKDQVPRAILPFIHRTLSSRALSKETKQNRIGVFLELMELDSYLRQRAFFHIFSLPTKPIIFSSIDFVLFAHRYADDTNEDQDTRLRAKCIIACAISRFTLQKVAVEELNSWSLVVEHWLNSSISLVTSGEQLAKIKLANVVWLANELNSARDEFKTPFGTVFAAGNFVIESAASQYENEFCVLWNQLVNLAAVAGSNASRILPEIRTVFNALHGGTHDTPIGPNHTLATYPPCNVLTHLPNPHSTQGPSTYFPHASRSATDPAQQFPTPSTSP
jgi:hypothetical protein